MRPFWVAIWCRLINSPPSQIPQTATHCIIAGILRHWDSYPHTESIQYWNLTKSWMHVMSIMINKSFCNSAQNTAVWQICIIPGYITCKEWVMHLCMIFMFIYIYIVGLSLCNQFSPNLHNRHPKARPWGRSTGRVLLVQTALYSASISVMLYMILRFAELHYNHTWLHIVPCFNAMWGISESMVIHMFFIIFYELFSQGPV